MFRYGLITAVVIGLIELPDRAKAFAPYHNTPSTSTISSRVSTFTAHSTSIAIHRPKSRLLSSRVIFADAEKRTKSGDEITSVFDPLGCSDGWDESSPVLHLTQHGIVDGASPASNSLSFPAKVAAPILALSTIVLHPDDSYAASTPLSQGDFNPDTFRPVCAASDSFYRFLQGSTRAVVGDENFSEYGPLIAGGLLRIRLELCVVESFFNEAVGPFIKENGLNWILPWHESVETFLAGTIFALATTFILVGSTKLIQVIAFYGDLVVGGPCRLFGGFFFDRARGEPVTLDVSFFGFWKTRLVGPPVDFKEEESKKNALGGEKLLDFDKVKPTDIPLLALSGGVKVVGEASKVSTFIIYQSIQVLI